LVDSVEALLDESGVLVSSVLEVEKVVLIFAVLEVSNVPAFHKILAQTVNKMKVNCVLFGEVGAVISVDGFTVADVSLDDLIGGSVCDIAVFKSCYLDFQFK